MRSFFFPPMPTPEVHVLPFEDGWRQWDLAVQLQDRPQDRGDHCFDAHYAAFPPRRDPILTLCPFEG